MISTLEVPRIILCVCALPTIRIANCCGYIVKYVCVDRTRLPKHSHFTGTLNSSNGE